MSNLINRSTPIAFMAYGKYWVNNHAHVVDAIDSWVLKYIEVFINAIDLEPYVTGTAQPKMNQTKLNSIPVALPPLAEQRRIVARVETLLEQTSALEAELAAAEAARAELNRAGLQFLTQATSAAELKERWAQVVDSFDELYAEPAAVDGLKQAILQLAVQGKLAAQDTADEPASELLKRIEAEKARLVAAGEIRKSKPLPPIGAEEIPFELPAGWVWARLDQLLANIQAGKSPQAEKRPAREDEFGVLKVSAVSWGKFLPNENKTLLPGTSTNGLPTVTAGDFLISRANTAELVGSVVLVREDYPNLLLSDKTLRLDFVSDEVIYKPFVLFAMRARWVREVFEEKATGTSSSMRNISQQKIRSAPIALPPLAEQRRIVARVEQLLGLCDDLKGQLEAGEAARAGLLESVLGRVGRMGADSEKR